MGMEPTVVSVAHAYTSRNELLRLKRPPLATVRAAAEAIWRVCVELCEPVTAYTAAMLFLHRTLLFNPDLLANFSINAVAGGCILSSILTSGMMKNSEQIARLLDEPLKTILSMQRTVMETSCFDLRHNSVPILVVRIAKKMWAQQRALGREIARLAFQIGVDSYETTAVLQFSANQVATAALEIAHRQITGKPAHWFVEQFALSAFAVAASARLLLEFYNRPGDFKTHAPPLNSPVLKKWLSTLKSGAPKPADEGVLPLRDPDVSSKGVARYFAAT